MKTRYSEMRVTEYWPSERWSSAKTKPPKLLARVKESGKEAKDEAAPKDSDGHEDDELEEHGAQAEDQDIVRDGHKRESVPAPCELPRVG